MNKSLLPRVFALAILTYIPTVLVYLFAGQELAVKVGFGTYIVLVIIGGVLAWTDEIIYRE